MRDDGWDIRLNNYVDRCRNKAFVWGEHDCFTFASGAVVAQGGQGFAHPWDGRVGSAMDAARLYRAHMKSIGVKTGPEVMDMWLKRRRDWPSRGDIVGRRSDKLTRLPSHILGVCIGVKVAFPGLDRLEFRDIEKGDISWAV